MIEELHKRISAEAPMISRGDIERARRLTDRFTHAVVARCGKDAVLEGFEVDPETLDFLHVRIRTSDERPVTIASGNLAALVDQDLSEIGAIPEMMRNILRDKM